MIMDTDVITFGNVILFLYEPTTKKCLVFLEEFQRDLVPLKELGQFIGRTEDETECQHLVSESFKGARINVHSTKEGLLAIARLGSSSDAIVRDLVQIVSDQIQVLDHVLTLLPSMQRQLLAVRRKAGVNSRPLLPDGSSIVASNLTKLQTIAERPPFKAVNTNNFVESRTTQYGRRSARQGHRFFQAISAASEPADAIRVYSCSQSGNAGRNPHLKDLPEYIVEA
ncbi:unnamed protein product [Heligmosomoides polygyrus]|uniref:COP9 signalosome complex subunit 3 n=1 Tax=Heligmosomoides polygyrus TaxID=6339 RepID=A0A183FTX4_HELPZ|nr:unnamed protein product [Heligmosomoides polygyrus]